MRYVVAERGNDFRLMEPSITKEDVLVALTEEALSGFPVGWPPDQLIRPSDLYARTSIQKRSRGLLDQMGGEGTDLSLILDTVAERRRLVNTIAKFTGEKIFVSDFGTDSYPFGIRYGSMLMADLPGFRPVGKIKAAEVGLRRHPELAAARAALKGCRKAAVEPLDGGAADNSASSELYGLWFGKWPQVDRLAKWPPQPNNKRAPTFGVVIPAHNAAGTIERVLETVLVGLFPHDRVAVVENGSTDSTLEIVRRRWLNDPRVVIESLVDADAAQARSRGVALCKTDYVAFCDADDLWASNKPAILRDVLSRTGADMLMHPVFTIVDGNPSILEPRLIVSNRKKGETLLGDLLLGANFIVTSAFVVRRALFREPAFAAGLRWTQDYEAWCQLAADHPNAKFAYVDIPLGFYRHWGGLSRDSRSRIINVSRIARVYSRQLPLGLRGRVLLRNAARTLWYAPREKRPLELLWSALVASPQLGSRQ